MPTLTTNDEVTLPGVVICFDTIADETPNPLVPGTSIETLRCGAAVACRFEKGRATRQKQFNFRTGPQFWEWVNHVRHARMPVWIFAHNLARNLTLINFWDSLTRGEFQLHARPKVRSGVDTRSDRHRPVPRVRKGLLVSDDPPTIVHAFARAGWTLFGIDTLNYFEQSSDQLACAIGRELQSRPDHDGAIDYDFGRCRGVAETVSGAMARLIEWHRQQELGRFGFSIAGIALAGFRHRFMRDRIECPDSQEQRDWERLAYYPGRVSCFWLGRVEGNHFTPPPGADAAPDLFDGSPRGPFYLLDASSFYGAIGSFSEVPIRCLESHLEHDPPRLQPGELNESFAAEVLIESSGPVFPVHHEQRVLYPTGRYWTVLCGPELARARAAGVIAKVGRWSRYKLAYALKPYCDALWAERRAAESRGDELIADACKALLARLHGKFLQKNRGWIDEPEKIAPRPWARWSELHAATGNRREYRAIAWDCQRRDNPTDSKHSFPALAAWVTATGREWLHSWIKSAGQRNVLYASTDSLVVTEEGKRRLEHCGIIAPGECGGLRVVIESLSFELRGPNSYTIGPHVVICGRNRCYQIITTDTYKTREVQKLTETLAREGPDHLIVREFVKSLPRLEPGGTVGPGGWVAPWALTVEQQREGPTQ
jgi:hypothetical protein